MQKKILLMLLKSVESRKSVCFRIEPLRLPLFLSENYWSNRFHLLAFLLGKIYRTAISFQRPSLSVWISQPACL